MAYNASMGDGNLRGENISRAVKGFAMKKFKMKQVLLQQSSNKWTETFYKESPTILTATGDANADLKGTPRGAQFNHVDPSWQKVQGQHLKHAAEGTVFMEDKLTDAIDVQARTIIRVAESIANSVDKHIYAELIADGDIQTAAAANTGWDAAAESTRKPISDLLKAAQAIAEEEYDIGNMFLLLTPHDYRALMENSKVINNPSFKSADVVTNGRVGQICGMTIIVSTTVADDEALVIVGQRAATWKSAVGLTSAVIEDKGIKFTIRSWEIGQVQVTDPKAIYRITDTQE